MRYTERFDLARLLDCPNKYFAVTVKNYNTFFRKWLPNQIRKISQGKISLEKSATGQDGRAAVLQKKLSKKEFKVRQRI